jgi:hypothetical protein
MARLQSLRSSRQRKNAKRKRWNTAIAFLVALVSVVSAIILFFNLRFVRISSVSVEGGSGGQNSQIRSIIEKSISGDYLWFIPKDSFFFFPSGMLAKSIPAEFPSIASVSLYRNGLTGVTMTIKERTPYAIACIGSGTDSCYYADPNGIIFESASSTKGAFIIYRVSLPVNTNPIGIDFVDSGRLQAISAFVGGLSRLGLTDDDIAVSPSNDYDFSLEYKGGASSISASSSSSTSPLHLIINESRPFPETLVNFSAFLQKYMSKATDTDTLNLTSVDMRYGDNIIYKTR